MAEAWAGAAEVVQDLAAAGAAECRGAVELVEQAWPEARARAAAEVSGNQPQAVAVEAAALVLEVCQAVGAEMEQGLVAGLGLVVPGDLVGVVE